MGLRSNPQPADHSMFYNEIEASLRDAFSKAYMFLGNDITELRASMQEWLADMIDKDVLDAVPYRLDVKRTVSGMTVIVDDMEEDGLCLEIAI